MKKKLITISFLVLVLLTVIIALQIYWSFSAYKLNKKKFDGDINMAMQSALDSCKKNYFDSIRVVMVKRLSDTGTRIKIDTLRNQDTVHVHLKITIANHFVAMGQPFNTTIPVFEYYRRKINHKATIPEVITEMSFYVPNLLDQVMLMLSMEDIASHWKQIDTYVKAHSNTPRDSVFAHDQFLSTGTFDFPPDYRKADSIKLYHYLDKEISKLHRWANFSLKISDKPVPPSSTDPHHIKELRYSETDQYTYKYHGFLFLSHNEKNALYIRAIFDRAQVGLLKEMVLPLIASVVLILFTILCFVYIIKTIMHQKKLTEIKDDFINNMTHELKTPIATITVAIEGLQKYNGFNDPDKTQRYLQTSRNELTRLNDLVSKVLNVAAFENKEVRLVKEKFDVDILIADLIEAEKQKTVKQTEISYTNLSGITQIEADKLHFRNVMANLIDNAVKYSTESVKIAINVSKNMHFAVFSVSDNGIGIPGVHIKHVFDKFHRVPAGNLHEVKGTGLGLNYVKYIAEAHGGMVSVSSEIGRGSEFIVSIPASNE